MRPYRFQMVGCRLFNFVSYVDNERELTEKRNVKMKCVEYTLALFKVID